MTVNLLHLADWPLLAGRKLFVIMVGLPGSGKSTVASALEGIGYVRFTLEEIGELQMAAALQTHDPAWLDPFVTHDLLTWAVTKAAATANLIVADTPNIWRCDREELTTIAAARGYLVVRIFMKTDWQICRAREWKLEMRLTILVLTQAWFRTCTANFRGQKTSQILGKVTGLSWSSTQTSPALTN